MEGLPGDPPRARRPGSCSVKGSLEQDKRETEKTERQEGKQGSSVGLQLGALPRKAVKSELCLLSVILNISRAQIHTLQRAQGLFIFPPVPGTSNDKSDAQKNHTRLMNQAFNEEPKIICQDDLFRLLHLS